MSYRRAPLRLLVGLIVLTFAIRHGPPTLPMSPTEPPPGDPPTTSVELFEGIKQGTLRATLFPQNAHDADLAIENRSPVPVSVKLPAAFGGVPILAQAAGRVPAQAGNAQPVGGGSGGMGSFYISPERVRHIRTKTACLDYNKPEPRPSIEYTVRPINEVTDREEVAALCSMLGTEGVGTQAVQAAVWHYTNGLSWQRLAAKRNYPPGRLSQPYFTARQMDEARVLAARTATERDEPCRTP